MNVLMFAGSLGSKSLNKKLLSVVRKILLKSTDCEIELIDLKSFNIPLLNEDDEEMLGIPHGVIQLNTKILFADALIISTPEYNGMLSGVLKNAIDWLSRIKPLGMTKKQILLMGATKGSQKSINGIQNAKVPFESLENFVYPKVFRLTHAQDAFLEGAKLKDEDKEETLSRLLTSFVVHCQGRRSLIANI